MAKEFNVGVKGIVRVDGKCLVLRRNHPNGPYWDIPGGRIDGSETVEETLERELKEELPSIGAFRVVEVASVYRLSRDLPDGKGLLLAFHVVEAEPFEVSLSDEHDGFRWVSKDELSALQSDDTPLEPGYLKALQYALL